MPLLYPVSVMRGIVILALPDTFYIAAVFLILTGSACTDLSESESLQVEEALNDSLISSTESWNVDMEIIEDGLRQVRLQGTYAANYNLEDLKETRISGPIFIQVYDSTGSVKTRVNSDRAVYRAEDAEFELFGDVKVRARDERRLYSEYLRWNQEEDEITTPHFVIITTPTDSISGSGFSGTTDLESYNIRRPSGQVIVD